MARGPLCRFPQLAAPVVHLYKHITGDQAGNTMADAQPTMDMGGAQIAGARYEAPSQPPPSFSDGAARTAQGGPAAGALRVPAGPPDMQSAPSLPTTAGAVAGVAAWQSNKKVDALWTINQDCNSWVGIAGIGWKKLAGPNETAISALTMLAAHARSTNANITYRDEAIT